MSRKEGTSGPLIVEREEDGEETWSVCPVPGICIKFRDPQFPASSALIDGGDRNKFFINLVHCLELPPPQSWTQLDEDEVAKMVDENANAFRIPICIGQMDEAEDHSGGTVPKLDVVVNSDFFHKRIAESVFFQQFTLRIICEAIRVKYGIRLDAKKQAILRNKKCIGELRVQRIRKRPLHSLIAANGEGEGGGEPSTSSTTTTSSSLIQSADKPQKLLDIDDIEGGDGQSAKPRNFKVQIVEGREADIRVRVRDPQQQGGELVRTVERITLKMNDDRIAVLLDGAVVCADFFLPFRLRDELARITFEPANATLHIKCDINWE